jgi:hypothetical protein
MIPRTKFQHRLTGLLSILLCLVAVGGLLVGAQPASAQPTTCTGNVGDPDTCTGNNVCMETLFGGNLNCTANDVRIGFADNVRDPVSGAPIVSCIEGSTLTFTADFHVVLTAQERFDIGLYFDITGDPDNNGARGGTCSVSKITSANNAANFINLDNPSQPGDSCGDINSTHNPQVVTLTLSAACEEGPRFFNPATGLCQVTAPSPDAQHCVSLPNCTSWRQTGANDVCNSPLDAFPGTKSKCNCDDTFGIPVIVEAATINVVKTASPTQVPETGLTVTYTVGVENTSSFREVRIDTLTDDIYGNLLDPANPEVTNNTCLSLANTVLQPGGPTLDCPPASSSCAVCTFQAFVSGNPGDTITDTVTSCGTQLPVTVPPSPLVCDFDDADVAITDVVGDPKLTKTAGPAATAACTLTVDVNYSVSISNPSEVDTLTVNALTDDGVDITVATGDIVSTTCVTDGNPATCEVGGVIPTSNSCSCSFVRRITASGTVSGNTCSFSDTDTVTANMTDSDGGPFSRSDGAEAAVTATVTVTFP